MAKKHHKWQQSHIGNLKKYNAVLQGCCVEWATQDLAKTRQIQRLSGEVSALRKKVASLEKDLTAAKHVNN